VLKTEGTQLWDRCTSNLLRYLAFMCGLEVKFQTLFCVTLKLRTVDWKSYASEMYSRYLFCCVELPNRKIPKCTFSLVLLLGQDHGGEWFSPDKRKQKRMQFVVLSWGAYMEVVRKAFEFLLQKLLKHLF